MKRFAALGVHSDKTSEAEADLSFKGSEGELFDLGRGRDLLLSSGSISEREKGARM